VREIAGPGANAETQELAAESLKRRSIYAVCVSAASTLRVRRGLLLNQGHDPALASAWPAVIRAIVDIQEGNREMRDHLDNKTESLLPGLTFNGRKSLRSVADALEKLRELGGLQGTGNIECNILPIQLPNGRVSGLVCVIGPRKDDGRRWIIWMPSAVKFSAISMTKVRQTFEIGLLNGAIIDHDGNVTLLTANMSTV
jgi:hypothetical protein